MNVGEIHDKASNSSLLSDPYVKKVRELIGRNDLFEKSPDALERMRKGLLRDALSFFAKRNDQFARILDTCDITPSTAEFSDLAKLAIPSDMLRGGGTKALPHRRPGRGRRDVYLERHHGQVPRKDIPKPS
jgi:phenylacetate-CoA ligase